MVVASGTQKPAAVRVVRFRAQQSAGGYESGLRCPVRCARADGRQLRDGDPVGDDPRDGLARPEYHGRAIGIVFMGISGSLVLGVPVGTAIDNWAGWRATFACIAFLTLPLAGYLAYQLPLSPSRKTVSVRAYWAHLTHPRMLTGRLVSVAMIGGHFTLFAYLTPYVQAVFSPGARALTFLYAAFGVAGVTGAWLGGWFPIGWTQRVRCCAVRRPFCWPWPRCLRQAGQPCSFSPP